MPEQIIVDFHTHTFPDAVAHRAMEAMSDAAHLKYYSEATVAGLKETMERSGVHWSVNLPVMTRVDQVEKVNESLIRQNEALRQKGIITFGGLHPDDANFRREIRRLKENGIPGVKMHPAYQGRHVNDIAYKRIFEALSEEGLIILLHTGLDIGFPEDNYAQVPELLEVIREVQPEKMVLAHMGGWQGWDMVEKDLAGAPVWLDTGFSFGTITPKAGQEKELLVNRNLDEGQFVSLVRKHGADRVLFATDFPWTDQKEYVGFIRQCGLTENECAAVLGSNALKLLGMA